MLQRITSLLERKHAIDHRPYAVQAHRAIHVLKHGYRTHVYAAHVETLDADQAHGNSSNHPSENANYGNCARRAHRTHGLRESPRASNFENNIDALAAGQAQNFFLPFGSLL